MTQNTQPVHYLIYVYTAPPPGGDAVPTSLCPQGRASADPLTVSIQDTTCPKCLEFILKLRVEDGEH